MTAHLTVDVHLPTDHRRVAMARDAAAGLMTTPKSLPPIWFYDQRGSELFDEITRLPEYYLTRAERSILTAHAADIVELAKPNTLVELGSGTSEKTRLLLDAMAAAGTLHRFVPLDVSEETIRDAAAEITRAYLTAPTLVGRDDALVELRRRILSLVRGDGGVLAVRGEPGSGRSRLLDACALEAKLLGPAVIAQASHSPSPAPGDESQAASSSTPEQGSPTRPAVHASGTQGEAFCGMRDARTTVAGSGDPSGATPLL